jgi:hypothetical protein
VSSPDWGAYLDGCMGEGERSELERRLSECDKTRKDFEGFKEFRAALREAALNQGVPSRRLEDALVRATTEPRRSWLRAALLPAFGAAILLVAYWGWSTAIYDPMRLNTTPIVATLRTSSPAEAARWAGQALGFEPPALSLGGKANLVSAQRGQSWGCFDYVMNGQRFYLYFCCDDAPFEGAKTESWRGENVYLGKGVGWKRGGMVFYLKGGDEASRRRLAEAALSEMRPAEGAKV